MKCRLVNENFKSDYVNNLLKARGIKDIDMYLNPTAECLQNPKYLENIFEAAELLHKVIEANGEILIIVDSDNDGFTSGALIYQYIKDISPNMSIEYILHEGKQHGLQDHIHTLMEENHNYDLIIIPDAGSNDFKYIEALKEIGIPVLVLDHHITDEEISDNAIVVNNQLSPEYHNKELTGAGVVYQFCRYYDDKYNYNFAEKYIDLAAWGIIGDMGSMIELENRYIVRKGLRNINNKFLWAVAQKQSYSITGKMGATDEDLIEALNPISVAFYIVPLVNAMIRVGTMAEKTRLFEAFLDGDKMIPSGKRGAKDTFEKAGVESARECGNARNRQNKLLDEAIFKMEVKINNYNLLDNQVLFCRLDEEDTFPSELNGLLAMKLSAKHKKPTIVARLGGDGYNKGSMRGLNQSELKSFKEFLTSSGMFDYVSGHDNAAGCCISDKYLTKFHSWANEQLADYDFGENYYDVNFERIAVDEDLTSIINDIGEHNGIWGQNTPEPLIYVKDINFTKADVQIMGSQKDTVKIMKNGIAYMKFKAKDMIEELNKYSNIKMEVVGRANLNEWGGRVTPQIFVEEYEIKDDTLGF